MSTTSSSVSGGLATVLRIHETTLSENKTCEDNCQYWCVFGGKQFAEGGVRSVFEGVYCGDGPRVGKKCLVKIFKKGLAKEVDNILPDLAVSIKTAELAVQFNKVLQEADITNPFRPIEVEIPLICKVERVVTRQDIKRPEIKEALMVLLNAKGWLSLVTKYAKDHKSSVHLKPEFVAVEQLFEGEFQKFNSNYGYENREASKVMPAFCHWSWEYSNHQLMVCDLQGVKLKDRYLLTDPVIHTCTLQGGQFGRTDLGIGGQIVMMQNHQCDFICKKLGLKNIFADGTLPIIRGSESTTYLEELEKLKKLKINIEAILER